MYFISVTGKLDGKNIKKLIFLITMEKRMLLILIRAPCREKYCIYVIYRHIPIRYVVLCANCTIKPRFKFNSSGS